MQFNGAGQNVFLHRQARLHRRKHGVRNLVQERVDLFLGFSRNSHFVRHDYLRNRKIVFLCVLTQFLHCRVEIFWLAFLRRLVALPFDKAAADRIILLHVDRFIAAHQFARHGVWVRKVAFCYVINDVGQRQIECFVTQVHRISLLRFSFHLVEEKRINRSWFLT